MLEYLRGGFDSDRFRRTAGPFVENKIDQVEFGVSPFVSAGDRFNVRADRENLVLVHGASAHARVRIGQIENSVEDLRRTPSGQQWNCGRCGDSGGRSGLRDCSSG